MPPLSSLLAALDAYWYAFVAVAVFLLACWRALPLATRDAIEQRFPRIVGAVRVLYAILPDLVGAGRALRIQIIEGEPKRGAAQPGAPVKREGFARLSLLVPVAVVCFAAALALQGCPPWERPACGSPRAYQCVNGQPHVCSPSQRLTPIGDQPCAAIGGACALDDAGVAHCMAGGAP